MKAVKETELSPEALFPVDVFISENQLKRIEVPIHWHDCVEIQFMLEGKARQWINDQELMAEKDDIIVINPGDIHGTESGVDDKCRILVIKFFPEIINIKYTNTFDSKYILTFMNNKAERIYHIDSTPNKSKDIYNLMGKIYNEFTGKEKGYEILLKGYIYQLIGYLIRAGLLNNPYETLFSERHVENLAPLIRYIEENYREDFNLEDASKMLNLSYYYLSRYFKKITGRNFKEYIDYIRVCEAEKLIISQNMNITQAAYEVGFTNVSAFCRVFKRIKNYSPGTIKRAKTVYK